MEFNPNGRNLKNGKFLVFLTVKNENTCLGENTNSVANRPFDKKKKISMGRQI